MKKYQDLGPCDRRRNGMHNADPALGDCQVQVSRAAPILAIPVHCHLQSGRV
jgi:hypothetical protein